MKVKKGTVTETRWKKENSLHSIRLVDVVLMGILILNNITKGTLLDSRVLV